MKDCLQGAKKLMLVLSSCFKTTGFLKKYEIWIFRDGLKFFHYSQKF